MKKKIIAIVASLLALGVGAGIMTQVNSDHLLAEVQALIENAIPKSTSRGKAWHVWDEGTVRSGTKSVPSCSKGAVLSGTSFVSTFISVPPSGIRTVMGALSGIVDSIPSLYSVSSVKALSKT